MHVPSNRIPAATTTQIASSNIITSVHSIKLSKKTKQNKKSPEGESVKQEKFTALKMSPRTFSHSLWRHIVVFKCEMYLFGFWPWDLLFSAEHRSKQKYFVFGKFHIYFRSQCKSIIAEKELNAQSNYKQSLIWQIRNSNSFVFCVWNELTGNIWAINT